MYDHLAVAAIAGDRAVGGIEHVPAFVQRPPPELDEHAPAHRFVADDTATGHVGGSGLTSSSSRNLRDAPRSSGAPWPPHRMPKSISASDRSDAT